MEIIFEFEDEDFDIVFEPDFNWLCNKKLNSQNRADHDSVQWKLFNSGGTSIMADVQYEFSNETTYIIPNYEADDV